MKYFVTFTKERRTDKFVDTWEEVKITGVEASAVAEAVKEAAIADGVCR